MLFSWFPDVLHVLFLKIFFSTQKHSDDFVASHSMLYVMFKPSFGSSNDFQLSPSFADSYTVPSGTLIAPSSPHSLLLSNWPCVFSSASPTYQAYSHLKLFSCSLLETFLPSDITTFFFQVFFKCHLLKIVYLY